MVDFVENVDNTPSSQKWHNSTLMLSLFARRNYLLFYHIGIAEKDGTE